jgi:hypothetical protein
MLADFGVWDKSKVVGNANGGIKTMNGNPLSDANNRLFQENPELFYEQVIRPIYQKMHLSAEEIALDNMKIFGRTGGKMFNAIENALPVIHRSIEAILKMKGINDSVQEARSSLSGQEVEFEAAWTDFKTNFGTTMLPAFTGLLKGGAAVFRFLGEDDEKKFEHRRNASVWSVITGEADRDPGAGRGYVNPVAAPARQEVTTINNKIVMPNGKVLAEVVTTQQANEASRPQSSTSSFDQNLALSPFALTSLR